MGKFCFFREFAKSTKEALLNSSPEVLQTIRNGVQHVHQNFMARTPKKASQSKGPTVADSAYFASPVFEGLTNF